MTETPGQLATRNPLMPPSEPQTAWLWTGTANGAHVQFLTTDPELEAYVRPILTDSVQGVELVDQEGQQLTCQVHYVGPPAPARDGPAEIDVDDLLRRIRLLAEGGESPLADLVQILDERLTAGEALPEDWIHWDQSENDE